MEALAAAERKAGSAAARKAAVNRDVAAAPDTVSGAALDSGVSETRRLGVGIESPLAFVFRNLVGGGMLRLGEGLYLELVGQL